MVRMITTTTPQPRPWRPIAIASLLTTLCVIVVLALALASSPSPSPSPSLSLTSLRVSSASSAPLPPRCTATPPPVSTNPTTRLRTIDLSACGLTRASLRAKLPSIQTAAVDVLFLTDNPGLMSPGADAVDLSGLASVSRLSLRNAGVVGTLPCERLPRRLVHVILTDNGVTEVPHSDACVERLGGVRKLMMARNRICLLYTSDAADD